MSQTENGRQPLRLGVVGAGIAFQKLHLPRIAERQEALTVAAVATRSRESATEAAAVVEQALGVAPRVCGSADELLELELDAVLLNVPIDSTYRLALQVLESSRPLICEKPLGESAEEAAQIVDAAANRSLFLGVCENFRYQRRFHQVNDLVASGAIGAPTVYFLNDLHYTPPDGMYSITPWRQRGDHRGGYLLDGGSHIVAGMRTMVGGSPDQVSALGASFHPDHLGRPWDTALANLSFDSGIVGHLALGYGAPDREARHPKILGTEGTIALKKEAIEIWRPDAKLDETLPVDDTSDGISAQWDDFAAALTEGREPRFSAREAVADLAVLDAMLTSATEGGASVSVRPVSR